jgi:hypothetical protein
MTGLRLRRLPWSASAAGAALFAAGMVWQMVPDKQNRAAA